MGVMVAECVRYFSKPYCFHMPPDHIHTTRCWDEEFHTLREQLRNAESDVRSLEQANKLLKQENFHLKEQISPSRTTGIRGQRSNFVWLDETMGLRDFADLDQHAARKVMDEVFGTSSSSVSKPTPVYAEDNFVIKRFFTPSGEEHYSTPDGKRFATREAAQRHMQLLRDALRKHP